MKKRILSLFLTVCLVLALLPVTALAQDIQDVCGDDLIWTYNTDSQILTISGTGEMYDYDYIFDRTGTEIIAVTTPWDGYTISAVVVQEGVTSIGSVAFARLDTLTGVTLPQSLTSIGSHAFADCTGLTAVDLSAGVSVIGDEAFRGCTALAEVGLSEALTAIGLGAFYGSGLTAVEIPASVTQIGSRAFAACPALTEIQVNSTNPAYASDALGVLYNYDMTELLQVPGGLKGDLTIAEGVAALTDEMAFYGCAGIESLHIPASVAEIQGYIFRTCTSLESIWVDEASTGFCSLDGALYSGDMLVLMACPPAWSGSAFEVPAGVATLDAYCFSNCRNLTDIHIPASTELVYPGAFTGCTALTGIWFDENNAAYTSDDEGVVFSTDGTVLHFFPTGRTGFYEVPQAVARIATRAFAGAALETILFTADQPACGYAAFEGVTAQVHYPADNDTWAAPDLGSGNLTYIPYAPGEEPQPPAPPVTNPFTDVSEGSFCYEPVLWAVEKGITKGLTDTTFGPNEVCTRGQVVTFLWRAVGSPEPTTTAHEFTDVSENAYYYKAMLWAVENGITSGLTADTFGPNEVCTRGQVVTFLWRAKGEPAPASMEHPFTDVREGAFYYKAMLWAVENGITKGMTADTFGPGASCNRGQVVTFLYRAYHEAN